MGIEGFNAVPEPVVPDESERVDNVEKAQEMAEAGDARRTAAVENRNIGSGEVPIPNAMYLRVNGKNSFTNNDIRNYHADKAKDLNNLADMSEKVAGERFDKKKAED